MLILFGVIIFKALQQLQTKKQQDIKMITYPFFNLPEAFLPTFLNINQMYYLVNLVNI